MAAADARDLAVASEVSIVALHTGAKKGYLRLDPFDVDGVNSWARLDRRPSPAKRTWSKPASQVRQVLALADDEALTGSWEAARLRAFVYTVFLTGARAGEIERLEVADVDLAGRTIAIRAKAVPIQGRGERWWQPKTDGSSGLIPIGDELARILDEWSRRCGSPWLFPGKKLRGPWTSGGPGVRPLDQVRALGQRAGVRDLTIKAGRKGLGTHAKGMGLTTFERREYFRHADDETGDHYNDEHVESMRPAARKIELFYLQAQAQA